MRTPFVLAALALASGAAASRLPAQGHSAHYDLPINYTRAISRDASYVPQTRHLVHLQSWTLARSLDSDLMWRWPEKAWDLQDSAAALWKRAEEALYNGDFGLAQRYFERIHRQYPKSVYAGESYYWDAFALYRLGGSRFYNQAIELLDTQQRLHPRNRTASDGIVLATRLRGELARDGNAVARRELAAALRNADECSTTGVNVKIAALNAFMHFDPALTVRSIASIFRTSSAAGCGRDLREQSIFILAQIELPEARDLMIDVAQYSREPEVRAEAVHWLADIQDVRAVALLESILRGSYSPSLKEAAMYALSRQSSLADAAVFREIAMSSRQPAQLRAQAILWLAEQQFERQSDWILRIYHDDRSAVVRGAIVKAVAEQRNVADRAWLLTVGRDSTASLEVRRLAIASAALLETSPTDFFKLYEDVNIVPLREQIIDILGKHREQVAVNMLIQIANVEAVSALRGSTLNYLRLSKDPKAVAFISSYRER